MCYETQKPMTMAFVLRNAFGGRESLIFLTEKQQKKSQMCQRNTNGRMGHET
jgi:hypothetical protein